MTVTELLHIDPILPQPNIIAHAAAVLCHGGLVAFPTETVYGLGANALDAVAVQRIFTAKGRPANNPLIVHICGPKEAGLLVARWPEAADRLAAKFWPGPLTLVLPRSAVIPDVVTAGGPTVAVRSPAHPVARALMAATGLPIAAPSANPSARVSATRAEHVRAGLDGRIELILDGGPTPGGIESTVLDLSSTPPRLLRPGLVAPAELEAVIGPIIRPVSPPAGRSGTLPSPGMLPRHYAPKAPMECLAEDRATERANELRALGVRVGWLPLSPQNSRAGGFVVIPMPQAPADYATQLYDALHRLDAAGVDRIIVTLPPDSEEWLAIRDRLQRAATS